ncbi:MAG: sodium:proton antiporter [Proteobacteria bacterium]|nr:sodium:proton antiporter [Pseudomonadota bacterium]
MFSSLQILMALPFLGLILSMALMPLIAHNIWHHHYGKIVLGWTFIVISVLVVSWGSSSAFVAIKSTLFHHYIPFITVIAALFVAAGGIFIQLQGKASALTNTKLLLLGILLANIVGTTGASLLLIRPLLATNEGRKYKIHLVLFFIFLVSNIGGCLTPLGDPPLFIGFLQGIDFFWTLKFMLGPLLIVSFPLIGLFFLIDLWFFSKEKPEISFQGYIGKTKMILRGKRNIVFIALIPLLIIFFGTYPNDFYFHFLEEKISLKAFIQNILLIVLAILSWRITPQDIHHKNGFTLEPLKEVSLIFFAIFITLIPVIEMLRLKFDGPFAFILNLLNKGGTPEPLLYFWIPGLLSSVLDNAPTYLIFFHIFFQTTGESLEILMTSYSSTLIALSAGSVFMGALTYIGNAPNFMVRSIALERGVNMPSFIGYILWSFVILFPVFLLFSWLWF